MGTKEKGPADVVVGSSSRKTAHILFIGFISPKGLMHGKGPKRRRWRFFKTESSDKTNHRSVKN